MRALLLDFNGTLSDDEPVLCRIFQELFGTIGKPLSEVEYYDRLAGLSDREIVRTWLGRDDPELLDAKIARYRELTADGSTITAETREAVRYAAGLVTVAVVSGSARAEIEPVLRAAGIASAFDALVASDDVTRGKPDPEGYLSCLELLGIEAADAVAVEDSEAGVAAAKAAGLRCFAVTGTAPAERLAAADGLADRLDRALVERLLA